MQTRALLFKSRMAYSLPPILLGLSYFLSFLCGKSVRRNLIWVWTRHFSSSRANLDNLQRWGIVTLRITSNILADFFFNESCILSRFYTHIKKLSISKSEKETLILALYGIYKRIGDNWCYQKSKKHRFPIYWAFYILPQICIASA